MRRFFERFEMYMIITDPKQSATTKKTILGELTKSAQSEAGATNGKIDKIFISEHFENADSF